MSVWHADVRAVQEEGVLTVPYLWTEGCPLLFRTDTFYLGPGLESRSHEVLNPERVLNQV